MKKISMFLLICTILSGCATTGYYANPNSQRYCQQGLGGLCEKCNRVFAFSRSQLNNQENITCSYCGQEQNLRMASNRYAYAVQQQQKKQQASFATGFVETLRQSMDKREERRYKSDQAMQQQVLERFKPKQKKIYKVYKPYGHTPVGRIEEE